MCLPPKSKGFLVQKVFVMLRKRTRSRPELVGCILRSALEVQKKYFRRVEKRFEKRVEKRLVLIYLIFLIYNKTAIASRERRNDDRMLVSTRKMVDFVVCQIRNLFRNKNRFIFGSKAELSTLIPAKGEEFARVYHKKRRNQSAMLENGARRRRRSRKSTSKSERMVASTGYV